MFKKVYFSLMVLFLPIANLQAQTIEGTVISCKELKVQVKKFQSEIQRQESKKDKLYKLYETELNKSKELLISLNREFIKAKDKLDETLVTISSYEGTQVKMLIAKREKLKRSLPALRASLSRAQSRVAEHDEKTKLKLSTIQNQIADYIYSILDLEAKLGVVAVSYANNCAIANY